MLKCVLHVALLTTTYSVCCIYCSLCYVFPLSVEATLNVRNREVGCQPIRRSEIELILRVLFATTPLQMYRIVKYISQGSDFQTN